MEKTEKAHQSLNRIAEKAGSRLASCWLIIFIERNWCYSVETKDAVS
jgi:hypothetical protein